MNASNGPVLLAYDGSQSSATAIAAAGQLLATRRALVCHVCSGSLAAGDLVAAEGTRLARAAGFEADPLPVRKRLQTWRTLLEVARRCGASLLVAGAQGFTGLGHSLLGSVSNGLVDHAGLPVLVIPTTVTEEATGGPLMLCYDGSVPAERAIATARELFRPRSAVVLHFCESWVAEAPALAGVSGTVRGMAAELDEIADTELDEIADIQSADTIACGLELAERDGFEAIGLSERATEPLWKAVLEAADEHSGAAIVVGSRGLSGISAALGSVSNGVVHNSRRPLLVVPPKEEL